MRITYDIIRRTSYYRFHLELSLMQEHLKPAEFTLSFLGAKGRGLA